MFGRLWDLPLMRLKGFVPQHSNFSNYVFGKLFGEFPKSKVPEILDFPTFPNPSPEINKNGKPKNIFGKTGKCVFGRISPKFHFWEIQFWENRNKI